MEWNGIGLGPDLTISNPAGAGFGGKRILRPPQNNTPGKINGVSGVINAVSCYKEAVQFSASFVASLFACL